MRKFTKSILALALLMVGATSVKAETLDQVYEIDYSNYKEFPFFAMGFTPEWVDGIMVDGGSSDWHQYFIADGIPTEKGKNYRVKALVKASADVKVAVNMRWSWSEDPLNTVASIPGSTEFQEVEWDYEEVGGTACGLIAQPGVTSTVIEWKKLTVYEVIPDGPVIEPTWVSVIKNGDLEGDDASCFSLAQPGVGGPWMATIEDGIGKEGSRGLKVVSCDKADIPACQLNPSSDANSYQWATQFFISSGYKIPSGKKVHLKFDYRADVEGGADVQAHGAPGAYNWWNFTGSFTFNDEWQTYEKTIKLDDNQSPTSNPFYTVAFNLGKNEKATTFYFDNIVMEAAVDDPETLDGFEASPAIPAIPTPSIKIGENGVATFVADYSVKLDDNVTAYAAVYDKTNNSVTLTKVTEIPLHTPVIVEAASGTYPEELARVLALGTDNDLLESDGKVAGNGTIYVLAKGDSGVGFYKLAADEKVPSGKGYLKIAAADAAPEFIGLNGSTTAIKAIEKAVDNGAIFNLAGQRVEQATKGLYIVNGKKVILK